MGVEYQLVKIDRHEYYNLGKGLWRFPEKLFIIHNLFETPSDLCKFIEDVALPESNDWLYFNRIANDIFSWAGDERLRCFTDNSFVDFFHREINAGEMHETGTRYI